MITNLTEYWNEVNRLGTPEAKILLLTESLFASTEAKAIVDRLATLNLPPNEGEVMAMLHERLVCLLIAHRGPVLASWMMERDRGVPIATDGPGPVVPGHYPVPDHPADSKVPGSGNYGG